MANVRTYDRIINLLLRLQQMSDGTWLVVIHVHGHADGPRYAYACQTSFLAGLAVFAVQQHFETLVRDPALAVSVDLEAVAVANYGTADLPEIGQIAVRDGGLSLITEVLIDGNDDPADPKVESALTRLGFTKILDAVRPGWNPHPRDLPVLWGGNATA